MTYITVIKKVYYYYFIVTRLSSLISLLDNAYEMSRFDTRINLIVGSIFFVK